MPNNSQTNSKQTVYIIRLVSPRQVRKSLMFSFNSLIFYLGPAGGQLSRRRLLSAYSKPTPLSAYSAHLIVETQDMCLVESQDICLVPKQFPTNSQTISNNSETIPKPFPNSSQTITNNSQNNSQTIPNNSQTIPKQFPNDSQTIPKQFINNS